MRIGLYPGSFNPFHAGHRDILGKALRVFNHVIVARGINPEKGSRESVALLTQEETRCMGKGVSVGNYYGFLHKYVEELSEANIQIHGIIRGLRNGHDLQYEMQQQYYLEQMGMDIPIVYFLSDAKYSHISSTAERQIEALRELHTPHRLTGVASIPKNKLPVIDMEYYGKR